MATADDIRWFKEQFHEEIEAATASTLFDLDMLTALACQETGEIWPILRKNRSLSKAQIVALCVGDTLDEDKGRRAFPRNKAALVAAPKGQAMFDIAHQALVDMAVHIPSYRAAARNANKFVHGYGVWQFDLQFFKNEPEYFLERRYEKLEATGKRSLRGFIRLARTVAVPGRTPAIPPPGPGNAGGCQRGSPRPHHRPAEGGWQIGTYGNGGA